MRLTRDATSSDPEELEVRDTQNDRGIVWAATWREVGSGGLYIDLAAAKRKAERAILIKSGDNGAGVGEAWLVAAEAGPPTSGTWLQGRRRFSSDSATVWKLDAADLPVDEAASLAVEAAKWIDTIAGSRSETEAH